MPIQWQVIDKQDGKVLLISKKLLDCVQYNAKWENTTWETSTLRTWLNGTFANNAFSEKEFSIISQTILPADDYFKGNSTNDKLFLLSYDELEQYFKTKSSRICSPTDYAVSHGAETEIDGTGCWWLRTNSIKCEFVVESGTVFTSRNDVNLTDICVRPAMWISLE